MNYTMRAIIRRCAAWATLDSYVAAEAKVCVFHKQKKNWEGKIIYGMDGFPVVDRELRCNDDVVSPEIDWYARVSARVASETYCPTTI